VGVVTGRIVPAISDGALARALRVLGAAGVAGGVGPPECVTKGRWCSWRGQTRGWPGSCR
jgi:hypothetical protein